MTAENHIEDVRRKVQESFSEQNLVPGAGREYASPNGEYRVKEQIYKQTVAELNSTVSKIEVFDSSNNLIALCLLDDSDFFHHWMYTSSGTYLLYSENLCGGNSVLNLRTRSTQSYSDGTDGFIFAGYYPSPDLTRMAVLGCFWGGPYFIRVFDVSNIESLPWPIIAEIELDDEESEEIIWQNNNAIRIAKYPRGTMEASRDVTFEK